MEQLTESAIVRKIGKYVEKCKRAALEGGPALRVKTKHLVELRSSLIANFVKSSSRSVKMCLNCGAPLRSFRQENRCKIFLKALPKKNMGIWRDAKIAKLKKQRDLECESREGVLLEEEKRKNRNIPV